jgi:hypothetical protein
MLGFVSRRGGELLMLDVARNTGRNMVAKWEEEGGGLLMFGCCTQHGSQHARNICSLDYESDG